MTDPGAGAMLGQEIGGVGHALHAAGDDDVGRAGFQGVMSQDRRLQARSAHLVHRCRRHRIGQARAQSRLPRWRLAKARRQDAAHIDLIDRLWRDASPLHRRTHRRRAQLGRAGAGQGALETAHGGSRVRDDDDGIGGHGGLLVAGADVAGRAGGRKGAA